MVFLRQTLPGSHLPDDYETSPIGTADPAATYGLLFYLLLFIFLFRYFFCPAGNVYLTAAPHAQCVFRNVLGNGGTSCNITSPADGHRSNQIAVASHEGIILDGGTVLHFSVVVHSNGAAAHVHAAADITVTNVLQMGQFGPHAHSRVLHFHEVAHLHPVADDRIGPQMVIGAPYGRRCPPGSHGHRRTGYGYHCPPSRW